MMITEEAADDHHRSAEDPLTGRPVRPPPAGSRPAGHRGRPTTAVLAQPAKVALVAAIAAVPPITVLHLSATGAVEPTSWTISDYVVTLPYGTPLFAMTTGALAIGGRRAGPRAGRASPAPGRAGAAGGLGGRDAGPVDLPDEPARYPAGHLLQRAPDRRRSGVRGPAGRRAADGPLAAGDHRPERDDHRPDGNLGDQRGAQPGTDPEPAARRHRDAGTDAAARTSCTRLPARSRSCCWR